MSAIIRVETQTELTDIDDNTQTLINLVCQTVSEQSARQYATDLTEWVDFAHSAGYRADMPNMVSVNAYIKVLDEQDVSRALIQRRVSAIRKLAKVGAVLDTSDERKRALDSLDLVSTRGMGEKSKREKKALTPSQATRAIEAWAGDNPKDRRNRAMIALLLSTGLRRSELAALKWADLDLDAGTVHVAEGKGAKARTSPIAGTLAIEALRAWREAQGANREYVFCRVRRGGNLGDDEPVNPQVVYRTCKATGEFKPHDLRRTFITELIETGTPVPVVADIVGHEDKTTTYLYAQSNEAAKQRENIRLRYG